MKRLFIFLLALIPFVTACDKWDKTDPLYMAREAAWSSLSKESQKTVTVKWQNAILITAATTRPTVIFFLLKPFLKVLF